MNKKLTPFEEAMHKIAYELMEKHSPDLLDVMKDAMRAGTSTRKIENFLSWYNMPLSITLATAKVALQYMKHNPDTYKGDTAHA